MNLFITFFFLSKGIRLRQIIFAGHAVRGAGKKMRNKRTTDKSAEIAFTTVATFARGVQCRRMEMAANICVPL